MKKDLKREVLELARRRGLVRPVDVEEIGAYRQILSILSRAGELERVAPGLYRHPKSRLSEHENLAVVAKRVPDAVICLLSALSFHEISTQIPHEVWIARPRGKWIPRMKYPPLNLTVMDKQIHAYGVEKHIIQGVPVKVYSAARTVTDCFKYRNRVGLDVALEALREAWRSRKVTMDELRMSADKLLVSKAMRPYLEAIV